MKVGPFILLVMIVVTGATRTAASQCAGDCNNSGTVTVDELLLGVNIALGNRELQACALTDTNNDGQLTVDELVAAVDHALNGCAAVPLSELNIPDAFDYATTQDVTLAITVLTPNGRPFAGVAVMIFDDTTDRPTEANLIHRGVTDTNGLYTEIVRIPARYRALHVIVSAIGIANDAVIAIKSDVVSHTFR